MTTRVGAYSIRAGRDLSPRMRDVLRSAAAGANANETAGELHITVSTVRTVRAAILARLGVSSMTAAVNEAWRRGLL